MFQLEAVLLHLIDEKELGLLIAVTIASLKRKNAKCGPKGIFKLVRDSVETGFTRENSKECLGQLVLNKSVNHNTIVKNA